MLIHKPLALGLSVFQFTIIQFGEWVLSVLSWALDKSSQDSRIKGSLNKQTNQVSTAADGPRININIPLSSWKPCINVVPHTHQYPFILFLLQDLELPGKAKPHCEV